MTIYYVYQLVDPRNNKPFYIGEGKGKRAWSHLSFQSRCNNPHKDRVIKKIHSMGLEVIVIMLYENLTKEQARYYETKVIEEIGIDNLTNICKNANPPILKGDKNGFYGKTHTEETRKTLCDINKGVDRTSKEGRLAAAQRMKNYWADHREQQNQMLKSRRGEKRSQSAIETYKKTAALRNANMTPEMRSNRSKKGSETRKLKYAGMRRQAYIDVLGKKRFRYIPIS